MTIAVDKEHQEKFLALREYLSSLKNNGSGSTKLLSHNETLDYLFSNIPIMPEVDDFVRETETIERGIVEQCDTIEKGRLKDFFKQLEKKEERRGLK